MPETTRTRRVALLGLAGACALGAVLVAPRTASARTSVGIGIGIPLYGPGYYGAPAYPYPYYGAPYYDPYYAPPPAYYPPPAPGYYGPQPGAYAPPDDYGAPGNYPPSADYGPAPQQNCRETRSAATVGGQRQWVYGTACQQPDGSWRNVE